MDNKHEAHHLELAVAGQNWMENMYFGGWDDAQQAGFGVHLKLRADEKRAEIRAVLMMDGQIITLGGRHPIHGTTGSTREYPGLQWTNLEPFRRWRIQVSGTGLPVTQTGGYMGLAGEQSPTIPFALDIEFDSEVLPFDWDLLSGGALADSAGKGHYDQGGTWSGHLQLGNKRIAANGLGLRDHSWGPRNFADMEVAWFGAFVYDAGAEYLAGLAVRKNGAWQGFSGLCNAREVKILPQPKVNVIAGGDGDGLYDAVTFDWPDRRITTRTRLHIKMPLLPERYLSNDAFSVMDGSSTSTGFAFIERGRLLSSREVEQIKTAAHATS